MQLKDVGLNASSLLVVCVLLWLPGAAPTPSSTAPQAFEWVSVPAGPYTQGRNDEVRTIGHAYQIMKYPVTNAQFAAFLSATVRPNDFNRTQTIVYGRFEGDGVWKADRYQYYFTDRDGARIRYDGGRFVVEAGYENHPVVQASWFGAHAFARHHGVRLPTEEEWEKAARGNTGWDYPWGDQIDGSRANFRNSGDPFDNGTTPVGYYDGGVHGGFMTTDSPSPYGAYDLVGNVAEWTDSYWRSTTRSERWYRIIRGGSYGTIRSEMRSWGRKDLQPWQGYPAVGFRCAR